MSFFLTAFLLLFVFILRNGKQGGQYAPAFLAGVCLGAATHVRPVSYYLVFPLFVCWVGCGIWQGWNRRGLTHQALAFMLPLVVMLGSWQIRNAILTGDAQFSTIESLNLVNYRAAMVLAERDGISRDEAMQKIYAQYGFDTEIQAGANAGVLLG